MGYASDRPVSGGEIGNDDMFGTMHAAQFAPSSTNVKNPGLGSLSLANQLAFKNALGIKTTPVDSAPPKVAILPVAKTPLLPAPPSINPNSPNFQTPPSVYVPTPGLTTTATPATPAPSPQTAQQAADNATTLQQQAAAASAAGNTALAKSLTSQSLDWGNISAAIQNAVGSVTSGSAPNTMGIDPAATTAAPAVTAPAISKEVVYAGLGVVALLLLLKH